MSIRIMIAIGAALAAPAQHAHHTESNKATAPARVETSFHFAIQSKSPEAIRLMSEGMAMIYGFNHDEAQRLFARAAALDPVSPMPWWGIALSWGSHINNEPEATRERHAWDAITKARALARDGHEKRYVEALAARYSPDPKADRKQLARNYAAAMRALHRDYPDDPDAAVLYAESVMNLNPWKYWTRDGQPEEGTLEFVSVLEKVLTRWPEHPGANHYYIHAVEASPNPEKALAAANRLGRLVPSAGHLVHMPSHIYARTGDWTLAAESNAEAVKVDRAYLAANPQEGLYPMMYYPHNIHFLLYARGAAGECQQAAAAGKDLVAQVSPGLDAMPMLQGFIGYVHQLSVWCPSVPLGPAPAAKHALATVAYQYARGMTTTQTADALARLRTAAAAVAPETLYEARYTKAYLTIAEQSLIARAAEAAGNLPEALRAWRQAVQAYDALRYDEPPMWFYPVRQSLAAALLRAGRANEAETTAREGLQGQRREPRLQYVLWKALEKQGKHREAALIEAEFRSNWKGMSDPALDAL